jgi:hypothetical protein
VEDTVATANTAAEEGEIAVLRRGNNPEAVTVTTAMAVTEVDKVDTVDTEAEAMDMEVKVLLLEAQLPGSNRMLAMVLQAWTATALHHPLRRLVESRHRRLPATFRRPLHLHHSSGLRNEPLETFVDGLRVLASGVLNQ